MGMRLITRNAGVCSYCIAGVLAGGEVCLS